MEGREGEQREKTAKDEELRCKRLGFKLCVPLFLTRLGGPLVVWGPTIFKEAVVAMDHL